jgi:ankyrin repeat protein
MSWRISLFAYALAVAGCAGPALASELHDAARSGDVDQVRQLLDSGANLEDRDQVQQTPLLAAALTNQTAVVEELIKRGANVMARNNRGLTPLHAAAYSGDLEAVRLLIEAGAQVNDADDKFKVTPLIVAAEENHLDIVQFLLDHEADVTLQERHRYTALTRAGFKQHWDMVRLLLTNGAECQPADVAGAWHAECNKRLAELPQ